MDDKLFVPALRDPGVRWGEGGRRGGAGGSVGTSVSAPSGKVWASNLIDRLID